MCSSFLLLPKQNLSLIIKRTSQKCKCRDFFSLLVENLLRTQRALGWFSRLDPEHWWENMRCKGKLELMYQYFHFIEIEFM